MENMVSGYRIDESYSNTTMFINLDNMVAIYYSPNGFWVAIDSGGNEWGIEAMHNPVMEMIATDARKA